MGYTITFMVNRVDTAANHLAPIFASYDWWTELAQKALESATDFEMRLWPDDGEGIASGQRFGAQVPNHDTMEVVFQGKITPEVKQEILSNYLTAEGYIKWFTLILKKGQEPVFASEHYGGETFVFVEKEEELRAVQQWAARYPIIWRVDVFERD